jgi:phospholipase C
MPKIFLRSFTSVALTFAMIGSSTCAAFAEKHEVQVPTAAAEVKHVFVIVLENKSFSDTFGTSTQDPICRIRWCRWVAY